jgi:hypothetical protein
MGCGDGECPLSLYRKHKKSLIELVKQNINEKSTTMAIVMMLTKESSSSQATAMSPCILSFYIMDNRFIGSLLLLDWKIPLSAFPDCLL